MKTIKGSVIFPAQFAANKPPINLFDCITEWLPARPYLYPWPPRTP